MPSVQILNGVIKIKDFDDADLSVSFADTAGESVGKVNINYISDDTGVTIIAVPENENYYPSIRSFPRGQINTLSAKVSAPSKMGAITMYLEPRYFEQAEFYEESYINLKHLEDLPSNMGSWERSVHKREGFCDLLRFISTAHTSFVITHAAIEPFSGTVHFGLLLLEHLGVEALCFAIENSPVEKYALSVNSDLNLFIIAPDYELMTYGLTIGQVVSEDNQEGIAGADVSIDGSEAGDLFTEFWPMDGISSN